jgi:aspartokinase-like uncharacterized kinase
MSEHAERRPRVVVKIGGSLLGSRRLDRLLALLVSAKALDIVIVPGGGPFADAIRDAQKHLAFSDALAHRLALDAMDHTAEVLAERQPGLVPHCASSRLPSAWASGRVPVWSPREIRAGHADIEEGWSVTSDSLAAWLAARIEAERLILAKSVDGAPAPADALARSGIVDEAFPEFAARFRGEITVVGPDGDARLPDILRGC